MLLQGRIKYFNVYIQLVDIYVNNQLGGCQRFYLVTKTQFIRT